MNEKRTSVREQNLREFTFSITVGAMIAMVLCLVLPEVETKIDVFGMYFPFWFCGTVVIWEVIDAIQYIKKERKKNDQL